jgi:outer membrane receptor protein involved in Fe transport
MPNTKRFLYSAALLALGLGNAAADPAPKSLHMRPARRHAPTRVAQTPPDNGGGDQTPPAPPPDSGQGSGSGSGSGSATPPPPPPPTGPATAPTPPPPATPELSDEELAKLAEQSAQSQGEEVITVTGSLIDRREIDTPSPISVVDRQKLAAAGITNVGDILQKLPSQGNALNDQNNNGGDGSVRIDLRSLGQQRTLTLLNGRRMVNSGLGADDAVDLGTIPLAMIDRVEVLKDGASAIYGSDAIAGVVNIITRQDFNGTEATVYTGTSQHGDGTNYDLSFVTGQSTKKGNITLSAGYQHQDAVMAGDRTFSATTSSFDFNKGKATLSGSSGTPTGFLDTDPTGDGVTDAITVPGCSMTPGNNCTFDPSTGQWRDFKNATATSFGDKYNFQPQNYLYTPSTRINVFGTGHYDITKNTRAFFEASYNSRKSELQLAPEPLFLSQFGLIISPDSMYNPFGNQGQYLAQQAGGVGVPIDDYNRRLNEFGNRFQRQDVSTERLVTGIEGKIPEDAPAFKNWKWEVSYNYGRVDATNTSRGDLILSHLANALGPSTTDPATGLPTCYTDNTFTTAIPGCVPLNILTPGKVTGDMINYLTFTGIQSGFNEQHSAIAQAHGKIIDLPNHGDISFAAGADYRHEQGGVQPDPLTSTGDTTGNAQAPTEGSYKVFEGFAEASVVPVSHVKGAQWVELDLAGRAYDYNIKDSTGSDTRGVTGKAAALWRTEGGLAFRGTYGTSFRAPSVAELYSGQVDNYVNIEDPCDRNPPSNSGNPPLPPLDPSTPLGKQCMAQGVPATYQGNGAPQQRFKNGGNPNLQPETANTITAGVVFEPLKGLALTADYWRIDITNAIQTVPEQTVFSNCYSGQIQAFCDAIHRDPISHTITTVFDTVTNVGGTKTSGMDVGASYFSKISPTAGTIRAGFETQYLFQYLLDTGGFNPNFGVAGAPNSTEKTIILRGRGYYDLGVLPTLRANLFAAYSHPAGVGVGTNIRYVGNYKECDQDNCNVLPSQDGSGSMPYSRDVGSYVTADLFVDYEAKSSAGTTRIAVGVNNVADATPKIVYNGAALNSDESAYDFMGRYFYLRLSQLF